MTKKIVETKVGGIGDTQYNLDTISDRCSLNDLKVYIDNLVIKYEDSNNIILVDDREGWPGSSFSIFAYAPETDAEYEARLKKEEN